MTSSPTQWQDLKIEEVLYKMCGDKGGGPWDRRNFVADIGNHIIYAGMLTNDASYTVVMTSSPPMNPMY